MRRGDVSRGLRQGTGWGIIWPAAARPGSRVPGGAAVNRLKTNTGRADPRTVVECQRRRPLFPGIDGVKLASSGGQHVSAQTTPYYEVADCAVPAIGWGGLHPAPLARYPSAAAPPSCACTHRQALAPGSLLCLPKCPGPLGFSTPLLLQDAAGQRSWLQLNILPESERHEFQCNIMSICPFPQGRRTSTHLEPFSLNHADLLPPGHVLSM